MKHLYNKIVHKPTKSFIFFIFLCLLAFSFCLIFCKRVCWYLEAINFRLKKVLKDFFFFYFNRHNGSNISKAFFVPFQSYRDNPKINAIVLAKGRLEGKKTTFFLIVLSEFLFHFDNQPIVSVKFNKKPSLNLNTFEVFDYFVITLAVRW